METYIGNVICTKDCIKSKILNVVDSLYKADNRFPSLIIGWDNVKGIYDNVSILDWKINDQLYWTHYKNVKRSRYEEDIDKFKELCIDELGKNIIYKPISLFQYDRSKLGEVIEFLSERKPKYCFLTDKEIYVYLCETNSILGFSIYEIEFFDLSKYTFLEALKRSENTKFIYHDYDIPFDIKSKIVNKKYLVPYLIYLFDGYKINRKGQIE